MNYNEGRWSIRLISIPSFRRFMCVPVGRPMSHESAGEREYFRRDSLNLLSGPQNRVSLPNKVLTSAGLEIECPIVPCGSDWVETRRRESFPVEPFLSQWRPRPLSTAADAAQMGRAFCKQDSGDAEESDRPRICLGADRQHHLSLPGTGSVDPEVGPVFDYTGHRRFAAASRCEATTRQIHFWIQAKASSCMFGGKEWPTS